MSYPHLCPHGWHFLDEHASCCCCCYCSTVGHTFYVAFLNGSLNYDPLFFLSSMVVPQDKTVQAIPVISQAHAKIGTMDVVAWGTTQCPANQQALQVTNIKFNTCSKSYFLLHSHKCSKDFLSIMQFHNHCNETKKHILESIILFMVLWKHGLAYTHPIVKNTFP